MKNLQRVDEYITHLKSLDFQTGWLFNLPKTNIKRVFHGANCLSIISLYL